MSTAAAPPPKRAARRQQLVENLRDPIVVVEDAHQLQEWAEGAYRQFRPVNAWQDWLVQQVALTTFRVNRIQRVERRARDLEALRAIDCWEVDRRAEVEELAARRFAKEPTHTVCRLLCTPAGCDWLLDRWEALARVGPAAWTDEQKALAGQLDRGRAADWTPALLDSRIAGLRDHKARLADQDAVARTLAESDLSEELGPALRRIRRHEKELLARLKWFIRHAQADPSDRWLDARFRPDYTATHVEPTPATPEPDAPGASTPEPDAAESADDQTNRFDSDAADRVAPADDQTNRLQVSDEPDLTPPPVLDLSPMTPPDRAEHRRRRPDLARAVAGARRARRRTG